MSELTRLEIKDIIANLGPGAEPEVITKLQAMLDRNSGGSVFRPQVGTDELRGTSSMRDIVQQGVRAQNEVRQREFDDHMAQERAESSLSIVPDQGVANGADEVPEAWRQLARADFPHTMTNDETSEVRFVVSDEDIQTINLQRATAFAAAKTMADARKGHTLIDFVETPAKPPALRLAVGQKNAQGDTCVKINEHGQSVMQCVRSGHGYLEDGSSVTPGCPQCFGGSGSGLGGRQVEPTMDSDDSRVEAF